MEMTSYDELLKQVRSLRAENSNLRQELTDNTCHLTAIETEASGVTDAMATDPLDVDDDSDNDINYDENGIHVFHQGGGGEGRDLISSVEEDISPNDVYGLKPFHVPAPDTSHPHNGLATHQNGLATQSPQDRPDQTYNKDVHTELLEHVRALLIERSEILRQIQDEDQQRKWYIAQLDNIRQKLEKIPYHDGYNRQSEAARGKVEYEAKQLQESFEQSFGTQEQISQRQDVRLQRVHAIESTVRQIQQQHRDKIDLTSLDVTSSQEPQSHHNVQIRKSRDESVAGPNPGMNSENGDSSVIDPAVMNLASLYHGAWPLSPMKRDSSSHSSREGSAQNVGQDVASVMSFNSNSTHNSHPPGAPRQLVPMATPQATPSQPQTDAQQPQHFGTKVEMVYSLLSMLGSNDKDDMSRTLLAMSSSQDSCIAMRQSGCLPLLIQLLHGSDKDSGLLGNTRGSKAARARAAAALHNIVHSHPDDKRGRREARVLRLLEQIRAHCDQLRESMSEEEEMGKGHRDIKSPSDMDHHPGPAVAALMKLSFDEEHRHAICSLGGVQAIAELIQVDQEAVGNTSEQYNITMRRYGCMALTNLTFGDGTNKALLCSMRGFMTALVAQLESECEDLNQVSASVLRNLSWKADLQSKKTLRAVGVAATLMRAAMRVKKEPTLKSILSALWNLSAHGSENKADICAVGGALEFLVGTLTYKSPSKTTAVIENGGGVLRNISSHITVREDYRQILRKHGCLQILLKQLRSTSLNIVSNACGTLWNLSARCPEDQQALWDMGAVGMLRNLVHSKHQMIAMGSSAALKNLLSAGPTIKSTGMDKKAISNRPSLHVRKQKALVEEIDHSLAETCENLESPRDSPTENNRTEKDNTHFKFPLNPNIVQADVESRRLAVRDHIYPRSKSGENTPMSDSRLMSPSRVARSGSQDSVGSTHSDISHDRSRFHIAMKTAKQYNDRKGGSLDRNCGGNVQRFNSDGSCERNNTGAPGSSRILQVMKEVANYAGIESENQRNVPPNSSQCSTPRKDPNFSLPHTLLYRSFTGPSHSQSFPVSQNHAKPQPGNFDFSQHEDDQQPIDYSMKYNLKNFNPNKSNNQGPPVPKYGNFMSPRSDSGTVVMQNSFQGNASQSSFRMHQMAPVIPQLSAYAETDLDSDQPVDYSLRYAESQEYMKERAVSYGAQYTGTTQNPADYNYQVARRTNDLLEQYGNIPGYDDDQVKTFCTEGTPRNYLSTANSLTDLSNKVDGKAGLPEEQNDDDNSDDQEEDLEHESHRSGSSSLVNSQTADGDVNSGTASLSTNQDTSTTLLANYHVATKNLHQVVFGSASKREGTESHSFHAPSVNDHSPDQTKTYCEEGTPICFSRVSSLSSLHSGDYRDSHGHAEKDSTKPCKGLSKISEHEGSRTPPRNGKVINSIMAPPKYTPMTGRQKMLGQPDSHGPDSAEKEHKTVTFNDDNQVQETPLMFSRCSSLGSLSSFDAQSVHSSVISDYSRRASEVVSPSELPDSPSETMPPSPSKSPEPTVRSNNQSNTQNSVDPPNICQSIEGTPRTVLFRPKPRIEENNTKIKNAEVSSTISCDEAPIVYADEGTPPHMSETNSVLSKLTIDDAERKKSVQKPQEESEKDVDCNLLNQSDDKENSSMSEVSEGEEDILKQCMSSALPPKMRRSSSDNTIKKKTMGNLREHQKSRQLKPIEDKVDGNTPKGKISYQGSQSQQEDPQDTVKLFASEDIPGQSAKPQHSKSETVTTSKSKTSKALVAGKREGIASNSSTDNGDDTVKSYAEEDLPFIEKKQKLKVMIPKNVQKAVYQENESSPDYVCSYANEGLPSSNTKIPRPRPKHFGKIQEILQGNLDHLDMEGDSMMSFAVEDTPFSGSVPISPQTASTTGPHFGKFDPKMLEKVDNQVEDEAPKSYACEDTPYNMSEPTSPKPTVKKAPPPVMQKPKRIPRFNPAQGYGSALLAATQDCHVDEEMPKSYAVEDTPVTSEPVSPKRQENKMVSQYGYRGSSSTMVAIEAEIPCDDSVKHYATEDTPVNFSHATSLSDLSIITSNEPIKEEEENLDEVEPEQKSPKENDEIEDDKPSNNENDAITNKDLISSEDQCQNVNEENSDENESDNSSSLDDSEDLLSDIIQSAMPKGKMSPKLKVSRKLDMDRAAEGAESLETKSSKAGFHPLRTSSLTSQIPQRKNTSSNYEHVNISNISEQHSKLWQHSSEVSRVENSSYSMSQVSDVQNNGMPSIIQQTSSYKIITSQTSQQGTSRSAADDSVFYHTNESSDSMRHYNVEGTPQTFSRNDSLSSLSIIDEDMRDPCTQTSKSCTNSFTKLPIKTSKEIEMQREVEGQSSDETKSVSNQTDSGQKSDDNKSDSEVCQAMQQQENDKEAINVRRSSSGSQLMSNKPEKKDDDTDEDDDLDEALQDALLEECMNSALPKSRSRNFDEKPKAVQSVPTMTNIPNKGPHLIKPDARKRSNRASLDSNIQLEKTMQIVVQTKGKDYVFDKYKQHRLSRSCSSADEMEVMNHSKGNTSHDSRAAQFRRQQINPNKSADFQFVKPSNDYRRVPPHGSWRRSRSQDSDGFLKRQKDSSNLEIAQSYGRMRQSGNSQQSIPTYVDTSGYYDNRMLEEQQMYMANYTGQNAHAQSLDRLSDRVLDTQEKFDHEKAYAITHGRSRHYSLPQNDELEMMNRSVSQREHNNEALIYNFGIDNLGFETGGSSENVQNEDSADITLQGIIESSNNTMCADDDQSHMYPHRSFDENISVEDQKALEIDASLIVSAIQNNRMMGSSVDEDMFIENETLSLVSGGYMSDTPSDVSVTWSVHSENISESTTLSLNDDNSNASGPRIIKPSGKQMTMKEMNEKGVRGRRKPLYSPRTSTSVPETKTIPDVMKGKRPLPAAGRGRGRDNLAVNNSIGRRPVSTKTHPQASSTPTKSAPPKSKLQKPSPPQRQISNTSVNKGSPSRLPLASTKKSNNSAERPKPPVKQGTFTKQNSQNKNVPVIGLDHTDADDLQCTNSDTWTKALGSYNFVADHSVDEKKENQAPKKKGSLNTTPVRKGNDSINRNKFTGSNQNISKNTKTVTKPSNTSTSNLRKTYSGSSLTKSGSGQSLNKSGSGSMLNKTGSKTSLNKSVSGASLNKSSSDRVLNRSNPSLSRKELNKSDSSTSLKSNSRPSTPVGRKGVGGPLKKEDSVEVKTRTIPTGKKQVNSKIAGLWKKEDGNSESVSPRTSASKLPLSYSTPSRIRQPSAHNTSKGGKSPAGGKTVHQTNFKSESPCDGMSRSSTYDKIKSINDVSQIPCLEEEGSENTRQIAIEMTPGADGSGIKGDYVELRIIQGAEQGYDPNRSIIISSPTNSDIRTPSKSDSVASSKSPIVSPTRSETLPSPFGTEMVTSPTRSEANSSGRVSMSSSMNRSGDDFDLKSLEKRIDSSTWRKKKSDLDSSCLPNADETEKSLEAVKALLDASINSQSVNANSTYSSLYNSSTIEGSYLSQGSRTVDGAAWRRFKETLSNVDQSEEEGESVWVRRDPESSKSEPELNKHLLNGKKGAKKDKTEGNKSFLPIKAMKSMFTSSKKEKSSKSGSKMSLSSSKESLYSHKIDMNEIVKAVEKEKEKRDKQEERRKQKEEKEREKERQKELEKEKQREKLKQKELLKEKHKEAANEAKKLKVNEKEKAKVKKEKLKKTEKVSRKSVSSEHDEMMESTIEESSLVLDNKNDSSVPSVTLESSPNKPAKSSPQSVLVPPFNYTPKECVKSSGNTEKEDSKPPSVKSPTTPAAVSVSSASPMTKTEMLLARRQQAYKNNLNKSSMEGSDLNTTTEKDKRGCMVTTV